MAPSTTSVAHSPFHGIIDISDDEVNDNIEIPKVKKVFGSGKYVDLTISDRSSENNLQKTKHEHIDEEHMDGFRVHSLTSRSAPKRNQAANIITIDDEDSYDENYPKCTLKNQHSSRVMAPSTPGVAQTPFHGIIDISDEDVNDNEIPKVKTVSGTSRKYGDVTNNQRSSKNDLQKTNVEHTDEQHVDEFRVHSSNTRSAKRKQAARIIDSDEEDSYDYNAPFCTLKTQHSSRVMRDSEEEVNENESRRHLTRLRKQEDENKEDKSSFDLNGTFVSSEDEEDDDDGVDENESEGESLGGFIVDSSESVSNYDSESSDSADESEDVLNEYKATLEKIGRKRITNFEWVLMGDMLSDFGKDPELCMSAVCAIYRRQTDDEKSSKKTKYENERGFCKSDASRGGKLAEFLMDGDDGDVNKTVEELKVYDANGVKLCWTLAIKYSKQLWQIYQNKEDHYFPPQR